MLANVHSMQHIPLPKGIKRYFFKQVFYNADKKLAIKKLNIILLFCRSLRLIINRSEMRQMWTERSQTLGDWKKKLLSLWVRKLLSSAHQRMIWFSFTHEWCVNKAKTEQNLWAEIRATNMCFQSGHSQHPTGFPFSSTQPPPRRRIRACLFPIKWNGRPGACGHCYGRFCCVSIVNGLFAEFLITADNHINLELMLQQSFQCNSFPINVIGVNGH